MSYSNRHSPSVFILLILALPGLLFWRWLLRGEVLFWGTTLLQFWPWHNLAKLSALAGAWPLWNPLLGNGAPLLANHQTAFFYPPNLLYFLMPVEHGLTLSVILHLALAGLSMYAYGRAMGLIPVAATVSALAYMLSGYLVGRTQFVVMINAAAWLPLLLLLAERLVTRPAVLTVGGLALVLALQLLAGHAQLWFYSLWLLGAYTVFRSWQESWARNHHPRPSPPRGEGREEGESLADSPPDGTLLSEFRPPSIPPAGGEGGRGIGLKSIGGILFPLFCLALAVTLAGLLAAVQVLPTAEFVTQSPRSGGAERFFALTYSFWPWRLLTLLAPNFFGSPAQGNYWGYANYWEDHAYMGVLPLLLAGLGVFHGYRQARQRRAAGSNPVPVPAGDLAAAPVWRAVPFFAAVVPVSLVLAMGWNTPVYLWLFDLVPGFGFFQAPARLLIWYTAAMACLAGAGAQVAALTPRSRRAWQRLLVACLGLTVAAAAGSLMLTGRSRTFLEATLTLGILLVLSIGLLLARPARRQGRLWPGAMLALVAADLVWAAYPLLPTLPAAIFRQPMASAGFLQAQPGQARFYVEDRFDYATKFYHYFRFETFGPADLAYWQGLKETLVPNLGIYAGLPAANNYDPLVVGRWQQLMNLVKNGDDSLRDRLLALMAVGYVVGEGGTAGPALYQGETVAIRPVPNPLPRAYFVRRVVPVSDEGEAIKRLTSADFDSRREVIIMVTPADAFAPAAGKAGPADPAAGDVPVSLREHGPNRVSLVVTAPAPGVVVLADTFYPGWQVTLDGRPARLWQANLAFRAVAVEGGEHQIDFSYRPRSFSAGLAISLATLVAGTVGLIFFIRRHGTVP